MSINNAAIDFLMQREIEYQLFKKKYDGSEQAAIREYGINPSLIAQAQLLQDEQGLMLVITPRNRPLDHDKLQHVLQRKMVAADELLTRQLFHCNNGGAIAPLPLTTGLRAVVDNTLRLHQITCFEANDHNLLASISSTAFAQIHSGAQWADICAEAIDTPAAEERKETSGNAVGDLQQRLLTLRELPAANDLTRSLLALYKDPNATVEQLARVIETDASLSAQTLRHARSPYYGFAGEVESIADAINKVLGFDTVLTTALVISSGKCFQLPHEGRIGKGALCRHSLYSATLARSLCRYIPRERGVRPGTAYRAALMQNMGFLLLGHLLRPDYQQLCRTIEAHPEAPITQLEDKTLGINHAQIGTWLMRSWNMPNELIITLREHHNVVYRGEHAAYVQLVALANTLLPHGISDAANVHAMPMLLKALEIPQEKAEAAVAQLLAQQGALNHLASSLSS